MAKKMFKIAIVDDEKVIRDLYTAYIKEWAKHNSLNINIRDFQSAEEFIFNYYDYKDFDIILLDIEMQKMSGVDLARKLRSLADNVQIIFISGYSEYIGEGYDVDALHFLIKPIDKKRLFAVLDKAVENQDKLEKFVIVRVDRKQVKLYLKNIYSVTNDKNYINISTKDADYRVRMTLKEFEQMLDERFYKVNRSDLVNIEYINLLSREEVELDNKRRFFIARGKFEEINRKLIEYF